MTDPSSPVVSVLVLSFNSAAVLDACLRAATSQTLTGVEVLCLDNASSDDSVAVASAVPGVRVLRSDTNLGYAAGMNRLVSMSAGRYVVFLNADCVLARDFCQRAVELFTTEPDAAVLGAAVVRADGSDDGGVLAVTDTMRVRMLGRPPAGALWPTFKPNGSCPVVRRSLLDRLSGEYGCPAFDERFDTYGEDVDLAFRLAAAGVETRCAAVLVATHERSHASSISVADKRGRLRVNVIAARHINARRHLPVLRLIGALPVLYLQDVGLAVRQLVRMDASAFGDVAAAWRQAADTRPWRWRRTHRTHVHYSRRSTHPPPPPTVTDAGR
ncbi:MAG TPA: glycosyltransferase [Mycobacteriales bacterium]|nr:glycosyltransferase [Mycobacteriales bacterium]